MRRRRISAVLSARDANCQLSSAAASGGHGAPVTGPASSLGAARKETQPHRRTSGHLESFSTGEHPGENLAFDAMLFCHASRFSLCPLIDRMEVFRCEPASLSFRRAEAAADDHQHAIRPRLASPSGALDHPHREEMQAGMPPYRPAHGPGLEARRATVLPAPTCKVGLLPECLNGVP